MATMVNANITALLEALTAGDEQRVIQETLQLLGPEKVPPARLAARVGIPAAWGGGDGDALSALSVAGRIAEWMRSIPIGPEPGSEVRRSLAPALPLVQGFLAVADRVRKGLPEPHPTLPDPILPAEVKGEGGPLNGIRQAIAERDAKTTAAILMGYYATGTDYRELLTAIYAALNLSYPEGGRPLVYAVAGSRVLDMADWGDRVPAYVYWLTPLLIDAAPETPAADAARAYAGAAEHDLAWLRTRLSIPKEEAAGSTMRQAILTGSAQAACDAVLQALRTGATPIGVASGIVLAAAERINAVPQGNLEGLLRAGQVLRYAHSVHVVTLQTQKFQVWPLLYTAASAVSALRTSADATAVEGRSTTPVSTPMGGLIAASMLRTIEKQIDEGDTLGAISSARRYLQMGHPSRALAGIIGSIAATRDTVSASAQSLQILPIVAAAAEEYLTLPGALQEAGQNTMLNAAIRLAAELRGEQRVAGRVREAINATA